MRKIIFSGVIFLLCAACVYLFFDIDHRSDVHERKRVSGVGADRVLSDRREEISAGDGGGARRYQSLYEQYSAGVLKGDPVSIDNLIGLVGACESGTKMLRGVEATPEVKRLQHFCNQHFSSEEEFAGLISALSGKSYSSQLKVRLQALEASSGRDAVKRELSVELGTADADQARMILAYASAAGIMPDGLGLAASMEPDPDLSKKLSLLSHIEFCRRGGDCGDLALSSLGACVSLPPCATPTGLLEVMRQVSSPRDYDAAMRMSNALHQRGN